MRRMETRAFGRSGLTVPAVGMGTWQTLDVRGEADVADRHAVVRAAIDAGTTLFDTSPMYGAAQVVLAGALRGVRERVLVADKVWTPSAAEGREQVRRALEWYGGRVDVYQVHNLVAWREHLPLLEDLRARGAVAVVGATHYKHAALPELMEVMRTGRIQMVQVPYNAVDRLLEREVLPLAEELGLGVMVMQPLGTGPLARRAPPARDLEPLAAFGVATWPQALLKWILSDPRVHCVIPATSRRERAAENAAAGDGPWFDPDTREHVARLAAKMM
jgi:aryl-alcohol dehydrogenase-like predicted oxidoreductase